MIDRKWPLIGFWIIPVFLGLTGFYRVTQSPNFEMYRTVDIVQLLASGGCFTATLVGVTAIIVRNFRS